MMRILAQIWSMVLCGIVLLVLWALAINLPKYKRVIPDSGYHDVVDLAKDETSGVDGTITIARLQRGDLIAYRTSQNSSTDLGFGYVLGLPGEVITFDPNKEIGNGRLSSNGRPLERGHTPNYPAAMSGMPVPANHVYVISDRHVSDSYALGAIPGEFIIGRVKD